METETADDGGITASSVGTDSLLVCLAKYNIYWIQF